MTSAALDPLTQQAISAALNNDWPTAVNLNEELLAKYPNDLEILNRLGRSYLGTSQLGKAKTAYRKVLAIDPYNQIALKSLKRLSEIKAKDLNSNYSEKTLDPNVFLEEPGRTKVLFLSDLAMAEILVNLHNGDNVLLNPYRDEVIVTSASGQRLGKLPEEWGEKIAKAIRVGSKFSAVIKSFHPKKSKADTAELSVIVREVKRAKALEGKPFFPIINNGFTPFVSEETISLLNLEHGSEHIKQPEEELHHNQEKFEQSPTSSNSLESLAEQEEKTLEEIEKEELQ